MVVVFLFYEKIIIFAANNTNITMTEKEKAQVGLLYDANNDQSLIKERLNAAELCYDYNMLRPSQQTERDAMLTRILGSKGTNCTIVSPFYCDYGYNIEVGDNFFSNYNFVVLDCAKVKIGHNVFIAPNVGIYCAGHPLNIAERNKGLEYAKPITIGNNVWIGAGVQICPGVTIGENSTIGAGSIVTKDIPADVLAYGNPCVVIRKATDKDR